MVTGRRVLALRAVSSNPDLATMYPNVTLKPERDSAVRGGHPWVFSGAVESADASVRDGELVSVFGAGGHFIGHGYYNGRSAIRVRLLTRDAAFWRERLDRAISPRRAWFGGAETDACRLLNGDDPLTRCSEPRLHTRGS
jgi:23S rRNA (cytosine1962-C5)-methyltransferase